MNRPEPDIGEGFWWREDRFHHHFLGAFQGGGARGIAYVGALLALRDSGCWFKSVAGSSAGAITATLIAAGMKPEDIRDWSAEAMKKLRLVGRKGWFAWKYRPETLGYFDTQELRQFIEQTLRTAIGRDLGADRDVTFAELFVKTGIELNVVVLRAPETPVILNKWSAPDCQISYAVAGSSAIPVVMTPQILVSGEGSKRVSHYAVDGGAWANYPVFAFKDPSARAFYNLPPIDKGDIIVGFVLQDVKDQPQTKRWTQKVADRFKVLLSAAGVLGVVALALFAFGRTAVLGYRANHEVIDASVPLMWFLKIVGAGLVLLVGRRIFAPVGRWALKPGLGFVVRWLSRYYSNPIVVWMSGTSLFVLGLINLAIWAGLAWHMRGEMKIFFLAAILYSIGAAVLGYLVLRYGYAIALTGVPAIKAAMRATTGVAEWVGAAEDDHVIRVPVHSGIRTTSFNIPRETADNAILLAARDVELQIRALIAGVRKRQPSKMEPLEFLPSGGVLPEVEAESAEIETAEANPRHASYWGFTLVNLSLLPGFVLLAFMFRAIVKPSGDVTETADTFQAVAVIGFVGGFALLFTFALFRLVLWRSWTWSRVPTGAVRYAVLNALLTVAVTFEMACILIAAIASLTGRLTSVSSVELGLVATVTTFTYGKIPGGLPVVIAVGLTLLVPIATTVYRAFSRRASTR